MQTRIIRDSLTVVEGKTTNIVDEKLVKQEFKKQCDINEIVKMYARNGQNLMQPVKVSMEIVNDLTKIPDYAEALNQVILAQESFESLDPAIRRRFNDDPGALIEFIKDPKNKKEGQILGIFKPDEVVQPDSVQDQSGQVKA